MQCNVGFKEYGNRSKQMIQGKVKCEAFFCNTRTCEVTQDLEKGFEIWKTWVWIMRDS